MQADRFFAARRSRWRDFNLGLVAAGGRVREAGRWFCSVGFRQAGALLHLRQGVQILRVLSGYGTGGFRDS